MYSCFCLDWIFVRFSLSCMSVSLTNLFDYRENKPKNGGICVANHTTPIDVIILANDGCYSMVKSLSASVCSCEWECLFVILHENEWLGKHWRWVEMFLGWTPLSGGPGARRVDGDDPASHGQIVSSHLVWKIRSQRQTPSGQKVTPRLLSLSIAPHSSYIMVCCCWATSGGK